MFKVMEGYENTTPRRIQVKNGNKYAVFPDGRIYRLLKHDKIHDSLKPFKHEHRFTVQLGQRHTVTIANIVAMCYRPNPLGYAVVRYRDAEPGNYTKGNLSWSSCSNLVYKGRYKHKVFAVIRRHMIGGLEAPQTYEAFFDNAAVALEYVYGGPLVIPEQIQQVASGRYVELPNEYDIVIVGYTSTESLPIHAEDGMLIKQCRCCGKLKPLTDYPVSNINIKTACKSCRSQQVMKTRRKTK